MNYVLVSNVLLRENKYALPGEGNYLFLEKIQSEEIPSINNVTIGFGFYTLLRMKRCL